MKRYKITSNNAIDKTRIRILQIIFSVVFISIFIFLFKLQVLHNENITNAMMQNKNSVSYTTSAQRGNIYFTDKTNALIPVAINKSYKTIAVDPKTLQRDNEVDIAAKLLSPIINISVKDLLNIFNKTDSQYEVLVKKTDDEKLVSKVKALKIKNDKGILEPIKGISIVEEFERYYPFDNLACHIIGFVAKNDTSDKKAGVYGLEKYYNDALDGTEGVFYGYKDVAGRLIRSLASQEKMPINGDSLITTIDKNIQYQAENEIKNLVESRIASSGLILVMDPISGKMLAIAGYPDYNLNKFFEVKDYSIYRNLAVEDPLEMGSVVKAITMSAAIDTNSVTPKTTYFDKGYETINKRTIRNYRNEVYGTATMTKVLEKSINTGAIFAEKQTGHKIFYDYLTRFKFNGITGIDLPNEKKGNLQNLEKKDSQDVDFATASYGHGILTTPLSVLRAYATIANNGYLVNPYIVETTKSPDGIYGAVNRQEIIPEQVVKRETAKTITDMLISVVEHGYGSNAKIKGYTMAGKTGTADIAVDGKYTNDTIQSFAGFFPAYKPKVAMIVMLNKPAVGAAASSSVTYGFHNMAQFIIDYYNIKPDEPINIKK